MEIFNFKNRDFGLMDEIPQASERQDYDESDEQFYHKALAGALRAVSAIIITMVILLLLCLCSGCSPKIIEREVVKTDTCFIQKERRDSIYLKDSVYVREWIQGDTVRIETLRWRDRWRERIVRDTSYVSVRDTIKITTTREVAKPLSSWQSFQIWVGRLALIAITMLLIVFIINKKGIR